MTALAGIGGEERYWVHIPARKPRAYKSGGLVAAANAAKGSPAANMAGDSELIHVNKYELEQLREMWGDPAINPETGLPAFGLFKTLGKIVKGVVKIGATVALTPVLGPVGAAAAVNAVDTAISGGDLGDIVKSAGFAAATAGAGELAAGTAKNPFTGNVISKGLPGLTGMSANAARAIGAGLGTTGAGLVTGQSFEDALTGGAMAGIGTYGTNRLLGSAIRDNTLGIGDIYKGLTNIGYDIANATGIGGGGNYGGSQGAYGDEINVTAPKGATLTYTGPSEVGPVTSKSAATGGEKQVVDENGDIIVTAGNTNLTLGPGTPTVTAGEIAGIGNEALAQDVEVTQDEDGTILVNGTPLTNLTVTPGSNTIPVKVDEMPLLDDDEIIVTGRESTQLFPSTGSTTTTKEDVSVINPYGDITPLYPSSKTTAATTEVPNLVPTGGTYSYTPIRRGLANIGFDPFTYGQGVAGQPGEFLFFTQDGRPYGQVATYTGPLLNRPAPVVGIGQQAVALDEEAAPIITGGGSPVVTDAGTTGTTTAGTTTGTTVTPVTTGTSGNLTLTLPNGPVSGGAPIVLEGGNKGVATPENTGYTPAQLVGRQSYYELMRDPNVAALTGNINKTIASQLSANKISQEQARGINDRLQALYQSGTANADSIRALATGALRDATAAYKVGAPITTVMAAQNPDSASYTAGVGPADVYAAEGGYIGYAEGGDANDDMVSHLIAYQKGGGHAGPGRVKGIGSGQEDKIPAWLSDGEYVWSAQDVADLGDGSTDEGVRRLDKMRQMVRKRAGRKDVKKIAKPQRGIDEMLMAVGGAV